MTLANSQPDRSHHMFLFCLLMLGLHFVSGCSQPSGNPVEPKVDLSKGKKIAKMDPSKLTLPEGFSKTFKLIEPTWIGQPEDGDQVITWDTSGPVKKVRDHYVSVFDKMGLPVCVVKPKGLPGETYEVRAFDERLGLNLCVGIGSNTPQGSVSCFIYSLPASKESWNKDD